MSELFLMTSITDRRRLPRFAELYQKLGLTVGLIVLGHGTVTGERARYFLDSGEKAVGFCFVTRDAWKKAKRAMLNDLRIDAPGGGVAFLVQLSSIGGRRELAFFTQGQNFDHTQGEESTMKGTTLELLVIISEQGYNEMVMDAARDAGARGGTVIHARGTGMERAERFFGISLASEKDMTFIVVKTREKDWIMHSIMMKAGLETPAKAIVFSLPVTDTAGLRLLEEDGTEEEDGKKETETEKEQEAEKVVRENG